jgi:hypothetical protein
MLSKERHQTATGPDQQFVIAAAMVPLCCHKQGQGGHALLWLGAINRLRAKLVRHTFNSQHEERPDLNQDGQHGCCRFHVERTKLNMLRRILVTPPATFPKFHQGQFDITATSQTNKYNPAAPDLIKRSKVTGSPSDDIAKQ